MTIERGSHIGRADTIAVLTFDCYGTLIDWQSGVRAACRRLTSLDGCDVDRLVRDREMIERDLQRGTYRRYGEVLAASLVLAAREQARTLSETEARAFAESMSTWPPFAECARVLKRLASRFRLAILSNVETRVLEASVRALDAPFDTLITAEMLRSYKPARAHFDAAIERLGVAKEKILHVACSMYHDIEPTSALGWNCAWVNREREALPPTLDPAFVVPDLEALVRELDCR